MSRNLDSTLAANLPAGLVQPVVFVALTLKSGIENVWSGIGDFVFDGITFSGVGYLGSVGPIGEGSAVKADGTTVTLSGIGLSQVGIPAPPTTPPSPPYTPEAGESVAWSYATIPPAPGSFSDSPNVFNSFLGCYGAWEGDRTSGTLGVTNGDPIDANTAALSWGGFLMPPEIPTGAVITRIFPVMVISEIALDGYMDISCTPDVGGDFPTLGSTGTYVGGNIGTALNDQTITATVSQSDAGASTQGMTISFVGIAVYYKGTAQTKTSLIYEALGDILLGAPAKIWYGHMWNGTLVGTPYLIFSGTVDKPTVRIDEKSSSITIALENRLVNLQRANQRRYTAADQHLSYPTDNAFNWIEALNDQALRWGS